MGSDTVSARVAVGRAAVDCLCCHRHGVSIPTAHPGRSPPKLRHMDTFDLADWPVDADSGVRLLGESLPYADGAENALLEIMRVAEDRSTGSDELTTWITDWPTRYHLSTQRANLLAPLNVRPGMRVLDVGAGTGAATRYMAEQGAQVLALEGSLDRARVAAARCRGLDNVTVAAGSLGDLPAHHTFDLVLCIGVLEYALARVGGEHESADDFVAMLRQHVEPHGTVAVAIENQIGLKFLLGYPEDHLAKPWEGVEGYQGKPGVRTYSTRTLRMLLEHGGLGHQEWLYPYPDYKLPKTILHRAAFEQPDAGTLVDQLVGTPIKEFNYQRTLLCDDRGAHRTFLEAGLGDEVANSFLVLASPSPDADPLVTPGVLAWHYGNPRLRRWRRAKLVVADEAGRRVETLAAGDPAERARGWLRQEPGGTQPFVSGRTLEQQVLDACAREDLDAVGRILGRWRAAIDDEVRTVDQAPAATHPFLTGDTRRVLPERYLDCNLDNFLEDDQGRVTFFDSEWHASDPVDADLVRLRGLWYLANTLMSSGAVLPWPTETTVDEITHELWRAALPDFELTEPLFAALREADARFQHLVTDRDVDAVRERMVRRGARTRESSAVPRELPFTRLRAQARGAKTLKKDLAAAQRQVATLRARVRGTDQQLRRLTRHTAALQRQVRDLLGSRRWRLGKQLGDAYDRAVPGRGVTDEEERLVRHLEEGEALLADLRAERSAAKAGGGATKGDG